MISTSTISEAVQSCGRKVSGGSSQSQWWKQEAKGCHKTEGFLPSMGGLMDLDVLSLIQWIVTKNLIDQEIFTG